MNNDRRHFLDGSIAPRKPLTEAKMIDEVSQRKIKGLIAGRKRQADAAGDQLANVNKAYLGVTGKPKLGTIHPKTAGTVGKATQGDDRLIDAGNVFRKQEMIARRKQWDAEWRLKGNKGKDPRNEEVTTNEYTEPVTEAKMIKYPADLEYKNHRDMTPAEKQRWIAYNRAYTDAVSSRDFSGIETSPSLGTKSKEYQDAWKAWNKQKTAHAAKRNFHLIKPFVAPKEKTKSAKQTKKPYFMDYPNKYEEVTTEAKNYAKMSDKSIVSAEMQTILGLAMQTLQGAMGEQDMTDVRYTKRVGIEINSERHEQLMLALEREVKKGGSKLQMWGRKKGQGIG